MSRRKKCDERKFFALSDLFLILLVLAVIPVLYVFLSHEGGNTICAEITVKGECVEQVVLSQVKEEYTLRIEGTEILVSSEGVCFVSSPCDDKICVERGVISKVGESAVCLPQRVSVRIVSESYDKPGVDGVAG